MHPEFSKLPNPQFTKHVLTSTTMQRLLGGQMQEWLDKASVIVRSVDTCRCTYPPNWYSSESAKLSQTRHVEHRTFALTSAGAVVSDQSSRRSTCESSEAGRDSKIERSRLAPQLLLLLLLLNSRWPPLCKPPFAGDIDHLDLSKWAFEKLAELRWGVIKLEYRAVPCDHQPEKQELVMAVVCHLILLWIAHLGGVLAHVRQRTAEEYALLLAP
eukprot:1160628-Pelagomonas_calceolata.AAC.4